MTLGAQQDPQGGTNANLPPTGSQDPAGNLPEGQPNTPPAGDQNPGSDPTKPEGSAQGSLSPELEQIVNGGWKQLIPQELKDRAEFGRVEKLDDLLNNYINAQQTISKSVRIPDANATAEEIQAFYSKLGKPASIEEYDFDYKAEKEDYIFNKDSFDFSVFKEIADKGNLTKTQFENLAKAYVDIQNENYVQYTQSVSELASKELQSSEAKLREIWGNDKYTENINSISSKITKLYPQETLDKMANAGLFRDANFLQSQLKLTKMVTGDTVFIEGNVVENIPQTIESLSAQRDKLMNEDYAKNKDQVTELNKQIVQLRAAQQASVGKYIR